MNVYYWLQLFIILGNISFLLSLKSKVDSNYNNRKRIQRIINGNEVDYQEFPFMVLLYKHFSLRKRIMICGGSIISKRWVLTAAHCLEGRVTKIEVVTGEINRNIISFANLREAVKTLVYEYYNSKTLLHDIGLLMVNRKFVFNQNVQPALLPMRSYNIEPYVEAYTLGWGLDSFPEARSSSMLKKFFVKLLPESDCLHIDSILTNTRQVLCTVNDNGGPCLGDSGGPLVTLEGLLVGVVSNGPPDCGETGMIVQYANVAYYRDWIQQMTGA